jgi:hypothetical protein
MNERFGLILVLISGLLVIVEELSPFGRTG